MAEAAPAEGEAVPPLKGTLAKLGGRDHNQWQSRVFTVGPQGIMWETTRRGQKNPVVPHEDIVRVRLTHTDAEAHGRPKDHVFILQTKVKGGKTYYLAAASEAERAEWVRRICAYRRAELAAASALGPSVKELKAFSESAEYEEVLASYRKLRVGDIERMMIGKPTKNGKKSELGAGSWSVQIQLLNGRRTWCNMPKQRKAPAAAQILKEWLPVYIETTRCAWENLIDPKLFNTPDRYDSLHDAEVGSYCEYILKQDPNAILNGRIGEVNVFISQVLGKPFLAMVEVCVVQAERAGIPLSSMYCWIDEFSLRFPVASKEDMAQGKGDDYTTIFRKMISRCGNTLTVMVPWHAPGWVLRIWCVEEVRDEPAYPAEDW
eukprot:COSAG01_NODE_2982_length_6754_cov_8.260556_1_plen_376_part_00